MRHGEVDEASILTLAAHATDTLAIALALGDEEFELSTDSPLIDSKRDRLLMAVESLVTFFHYFRRYLTFHLCSGSSRTL